MKIDFSNSPNMSRAIECYKTNNFSEAISLFSEDEKRNNFEVIQFIGVCLFKIKKYPAALSYLEICINAEPSKCSKQAWLYYFNIYAMQDNVVLCKEILQQAKKYKKFDFRLAKTALDRFCDTDDTMALDIVNEMYPFVEEYCYKNQLKVPQRFSSAYARYHISLNSTYNKEKIEIPDEILNEFEILIPTYKRKDIVVSTIREMKNVNEKIHIRVIDNASDDGSFEALQELVKEFPNLYVSQNKENIGYAGNMVKVVECCKKKLGVITSNEEPVIVKNIVEIVKYMLSNGIDFVSPQFFKKSKLLRGRSFIVDMPVQDFGRSIADFPGIIVNSYKLQKFFQQINIWQYMYFEQVYPQVYMSIYLLLFGKCSYYNLPSVYVKHTLENQSVSRNKSYVFVDKRWQQAREFAKLVDVIEQIFPSCEEQKLRIQKLKEAIMAPIFATLKKAATKEFPQYKNFFY